MNAERWLKRFEELVAPLNAANRVETLRADLEWQHRLQRQAERTAEAIHYASAECQEHEALWREYCEWRQEQATAPVDES